MQNKTYCTLFAMNKTKQSSLIYFFCRITDYDCRCDQFYGWRKQDYSKNTKKADLPQVTDKLYYVKLKRIHLAKAGY